MKLNQSQLYPVSNSCRFSVPLDGMWDFQFDPGAIGEENNWQNKLPDPIFMPISASFSDLFTTHEERDYTGDFWYQTTVQIPAEWNGCICVRFGSIAHHATVYCNGVKVCTHDGGFLPVVADITAAAKRGEKNILTVKANNELTLRCLPCGKSKTLPDGRKYSVPFFDFYNYGGIHRGVQLVHTPLEAITDYDTDFTLQGKDAIVHYCVKTNGTNPVFAELRDADGKTVAQCDGATGALFVKNAKLWRIHHAYLYTLVLTIRDGERILDQYEAQIGIRMIQIDGTRILLNGEPVYLKGFGKHEDAEIIGKGFNWAIAKRDFECMKWIGANCFRTSHYPYADEWYQIADREGFLIIDEVPGVGMVAHEWSFLVAASGGSQQDFYETENIEALKQNHLMQLTEMITRDKNHPSVIAWSIANEAQTCSEKANLYFKDLFEAAHALDLQKRPRTMALEKSSGPDSCKCYPLCDFISLNRYYGWYIKGGTEISIAKQEFYEEMDQWASLNLNKPFVFTEFGTDTVPTEHKLPSVMWSQEYQVEYMELNFSVFDAYDFVQGELAWNFADFQTGEGTSRVNGNRKGVFSRNRQPKDAAYTFKKRWEAMESGKSGK